MDMVVSSDLKKLYYGSYRAGVEDLDTRQLTSIGQKLFEVVLKEAQRKGCKLMKWQVLDWNEPAIRFYEKNKATIEKEWWNGKIFFE